MSLSWMDKALGMINLYPSVREMGRSRRRAHRERLGRIRRRAVLVVPKERWALRDSNSLHSSGTS